MPESGSPEAEPFRAPYLAAGERRLDEMFGRDEKLKPHWLRVVERFESFTPEELYRVLQATERHIHENGLAFNVHGEGNDRPYSLDPVPFVVGAEDWKAIEAGLEQRARLLNVILRDLYGERRLIRERLLPPELVFGHPGFVRECDQIRIPGEHELLIYHADLARGPDGRMWVINDRAQAPSGSGYALENRVVLSQVLPSLFRECRVRRLSGFFRQLKAKLESLAPHAEGDPHIVILTPGPLSETYFEHAYLAAYLGWTLVQGNDLTVRDGRVWLKSLAGLEPVDVIWRRCDALFCDPLELRADSQLGVAGLLQAVRLGNVVVANPLGSGVLENPGLLAFLPGIARALLGEELALPSAATWWCGQEKEREYVLTNLEKFVVKSVFRSPDFGSVFCSRLSRKELSELRERILAEPARFVGQEEIRFSTAPCSSEGRLEPRHSVFRGILAASASGYAILPGGLTRSAGEPDSRVVDSSSGGLAKDTWVLGERTEPFVSLWPRVSQRAAADGHNLPSRSGENLYWVGRYAERAETTARILRRILARYTETDSTQDELERAEIEVLLAAVQHVTRAAPREDEDGSSAESSHPDREILSLLGERRRLGSLSSTVGSFLNACYAVRDQWSSDSWRVIDAIEDQWVDRKSRSLPAEVFGFPEELNRLILRLMALAGINGESMTRGAGWVLLDCGRRIERSQLITGLLQSMLVESRGSELDDLAMESLLVACDSLVTHGRRFRSQPTPETILELLLRDENYPRSVFYQVSRMARYLPGLPGFRRFGEEHPVALVLNQAYLALAECDVGRLARLDAGEGRGELVLLLHQLSEALLELSDALTRAYFDHSGLSSSLRA